MPDPLYADPAVVSAQPDTHGQIIPKARTSRPVNRRVTRCTATARLASPQTDQPAESDRPLNGLGVPLANSLGRVLRAVLTADEDAFGQALSDLLAGGRVIEVVERDDGCVFTGDVSYYVAPFRSWWPQERRAMRFVRGRVLDLGCGAGRVSLHLQDRGFEVVAIDVSPLAVEVARQRGDVDARVGTLDTALESGERFDTTVLLGNNLGLLAGERQGRQLLRKLARLSSS